MIYLHEDLKHLVLNAYFNGFVVCLVCLHPIENHYSENEDLNGGCESSKDEANMCQCSCTPSDIRWKFHWKFKWRLHKNINNKMEIIFKKDKNMKKF